MDTHKMTIDLKPETPFPRSSLLPLSHQHHRCSIIFDPILGVETDEAPLVS